MIKKPIILGIAILVVVTLVIGWSLIPSAGGAITNWNSVDPNISGQWKTELWIQFEDGSEVLADDLGDDLLSVFFTQPESDQKVTALLYKVSAKATTDGTYTTAYLDLSDVKYGLNIMLQNTATTIYDGPVTPTPPLSPISIPVDNQFYEIFSYGHLMSATWIQNAVENNPYSGYSFGCYTDGVINFRGSADEEWKTIDDPALVTIALIAISNELFVDLSGEITVIYA